jgi:hypothetical protein
MNTKHASPVAYPIWLVLSLLAAIPAVWLMGLPGCAQIQPLTGGERDTIPPQLDSAFSTPNLQTRFEKQPIVLAFDEFIDLKDVFNQVVVSPPLSKQPEVTVEKYKRVRFAFHEEEVLRPDATYTIQFGEAIRDFTEGNASPIRFIFSTGDHIDSLEVQGQVVDAFTGKPVEKVWVMLYDNLADSVVRTERPFYFSKTDKEGNFRIEYVKADTFKVFALEDGNLNYRYDQITERIGFLDDPIFVDDSLQPPIAIRFFQETPPLLLEDQRSPTEGLVKLAFNRETWDLVLQTSEPVFSQETVGDTIYLWHEIPDTASWRVFLETAEGIDTVSIRQGTGKKPQTLKPAGAPKPQNPTQKLELSLNYPLKAAVWDSVQLWQDSVRLEMPVSGQIDSLNPRKAWLSFDWQENQSYRLFIPPGALSGWRETTNDSLLLDYRIGQRKDYGDLTLRFDSLQTPTPLALELLQQDKVVERFTIAAGTENWTKKLTALSPGNYQLRVIEDRNGNGRWDPGHYDRKRQPERLQVIPLEALRANWEVETNLNVEWEKD